MSTNLTHSNLTFVFVNEIIDGIKAKSDLMPELKEVGNNEGIYCIVEKSSDEADRIIHYKKAIWIYSIIKKPNTYCFQFVIDRSYFPLENNSTEDINKNPWISEEFNVLQIDTIVTKCIELLKQKRK